MDIINWFGGEVTRLSQTDPERARRLLLTGYRANLLALRLRPDRRLSPGRNFAARSVMELILTALAHPQRAALVSLFTPCEPLFAAGITPYSLEAVSGYLMGTRCETRFLETAAENGASETMCSFHRAFLGAAENGLLPKPRFIVYTNLACDGNMITFPYLRDRFKSPCFFIDVPYEKSEDAARDVAAQLRRMKEFTEDVTGRRITDDALRAAVRRSRLSRESYLRYLEQESARRLPTDATGEMYAAFMSHILLGSEDAEKYFAAVAAEIAREPATDAKRLLWVHAIPYMQPALRKALNFNDKVYITACDLCYDNLLTPQDESEPYLSMARRLVYSGYNGPAEGRIRNAVEMARRTKADGAVVFAHWGCKATLGAAQLMKSALEAEGLPTLVLDGDACCPENTGDGQMSTRLGAFLEMLGAEK